jgi:hypothetical protein
MDSFRLRNIDRQYFGWEFWRLVYADHLRDGVSVCMCVLWGGEMMQ